MGLGTNTRSSARTESHLSCLELFGFVLVFVVFFGMQSLANLKLPNQAKLSRGPRINLSLSSTINTINTCHHTQIYFFFFNFLIFEAEFHYVAFATSAGTKGMDYHAQSYIQIFFKFGCKLKSSYFIDRYLTVPEMFTAENRALRAEQCQMCHSSTWEVKTGISGI